MERRKVTDAHEARTLLEEQRNSGMSPAGFARSHGIDGRSLNAWRLNLARSQVAQKDLQFLELVTSEHAPAPCLTVRCGPFAVEVPAHFDADELARLLLVVAAC